MAGAAPHVARQPFTFRSVQARERHAMKRRCIFPALLGVLGGCAFAAGTLRNDRYTLDVADDGAVTVRAGKMTPQVLTPEFTVLWSDTDPLCTRDASHPNYPVAPRVAVRWRNPGEPIGALNAWVGS